jgi:hypothetical protein
LLGIDYTVQKNPKQNKKTVSYITVNRIPIFAF